MDSETEAHRPAFRRTIIALALACHLPPTVAVTAVSAALAVTIGRGPGGTVAVAVAVLAGQLTIGWTNDYLDRGRDIAVGRRDKPLTRGDITPVTVRVAAIVAAVAVVPLSLLSGVVAAVLHLVAVASGLTYDRWLKSTVVSVLPFVVSFGLLPAFVVAGLSGHPAPPAWLVAAGALLGAAAHFANVLPDLDDDARTGVRGLPHRLGATPSRIVTVVLLTAACLTLGFAPPGPVRPGQVIGVVVALVVGVSGLVIGRRPGSRAAFYAVLVAAAIDVALLLAAGHDVPAVVG